MSATALPRHCPDCGTKTAEGDRFCGGCGSRFEGTGPAAPAKNAPEESPRGSSRSSALLVPAAVLLIGAGVGAGRAYLGRPAKVPAIVEAPTRPSVIAVPSLVGLTQDSARSTLEKVGLALGEDPKRANVPEAKGDTVVAQDPKPSASLARGGSVRVTVQDGSLPASSPHAYNYTLAVDLSGLPEHTQVRIEMEDLNGRRVVQDHPRHPGDRVSVTARGRGDSVNWRIYYDDRLVKTVGERSDGTQVDGGTL